jgi:TPR repeat protein
VVDETAVADALADAQQGRHAEAVARLLPAAEAGNAAAQYHLGLAYARGEGIAQDFTAAGRWIVAAATQGHGHAQYIAGHMASRGEGVPRDLAQAHCWYTLANESGWWKAREAREKLVDAGMTLADVTRAGRLCKAFRQQQRTGDDSDAPADAR